MAAVAVALGVALTFRRLGLGRRIGGPDPAATEASAPAWARRTSFALLGLSLVALVASTVRAS